jgi:3-oxoacyl-[acyl-carrier protein] reductase
MQNPQSRLHRPAVLVTGASGGIGSAICRAFGRAGWEVGLHYCRHKAAAEDILHHIVAAGGTGELYQADLRDAQSVQRMMEAFGLRSRLPSAVICNAGVGGSSLLLRQREDAWAEAIAINLTGTFHCFRAAAPVLMRHGGGSIIVIGSYAGFQGSTGQAAYAASKAGLIGLVKSAAREWGADNIRVNMLLPGWQRTALSEDAMPEDEAWTDHALRRPPSIEEVADTVVHLARLKSTSGQVWNCDSRNL